MPVAPSRKKMYANIDTRWEKGGLFLKNENYSPGWGKDRGKNQSKSKRAIQINNETNKVDIEVVFSRVVYAPVLGDLPDRLLDRK